MKLSGMLIVGGLVFGLFVLMSWYLGVSKEPESCVVRHSDTNELLNYTLIDGVYTAEYKGKLTTKFLIDCSK